MLDPSDLIEYTQLLADCLMNPGSKSEEVTKTNKVNLKLIGSRGNQAEHS